MWLRIGRRTRACAAVALASLLLAACASTPVDEVRISVKRIALRLAFENEELAQPIAPERIINLIPAPPELVASGDLAPFRTPEPSQITRIEKEPPLCPSAPEGAALLEPVAITVDEPPKPGWYRRHNRGKLTITGGAIPLTLPFPRVTLMEIRDVHQVERPAADHRAGDVARDEAPPLADAGQAIRSATATRFTVSHQIATITISDVYEYDDDGFRLVERTTKTDAATAVFRPTPQITLVTLGDFGGDWAEGGTDRESSTSMIVRGEIVAQEPVDVCGTLIDSLRFENDEQTVNLTNQETSGTAEIPNIYNIAPQHHGLIVQEEKHFTQVATIDNLKLVIDWDYVSTIGHLEPFPTRDAALERLFR